MTQADVAEKLGVIHELVGAYESGSVLPSMAMAGELAKALDCAVEDLYNVEQTYIPVSLKFASNS